MKKTSVLTALLMTMMLASDGMAADAAAQKKHHGKVVGTVMFVGGVALIGASAFVLADYCPARAQLGQISRGAGVCGSSWLEKDKNTIGASAIGVGAALAVGGIVILRQSEHAAAVPVPTTLKPATPGN